MSAAKPVPNTAAPPSRGDNLRLLIVLVAGHAIKHLFSAGFFIILPEIKAGLALSNTNVGALSTVRNIAAGFTNLPAGFAADRFSHRFTVILALCMLFIGIFQFALGQATTYWQALLLATLVIIAITFWHPAAIGTLNRVYERRRGFAIALHGTGGSMGETLGPIITGGLLAILVWRTVLEVSLIPAVLTAALVWLLLRSRPVEIRQVTLGGYARAFADLLRNRKLLLILGITAGFAAVQSSIFTFLPVYLREDRGHSTLVVGLYISLAQVVGIVSQPFMGYLSDRLSRKAVLFPTLFCEGLLCLALYLTASGIPFIVALAALGAFLFSGMALLLAAAADVVGSEAQATTVSMVFSASTFFAGFSPFFAGLVADAFGTQSVFLYASIIALATSAYTIMTRWQAEARRVPVAA